MDDKLAERLARLASEEGTSQAQVLREAIASYRPKLRSDRDFALADGFERIDDDPRPISEIPDEELLKGFGK